MTTIKSAPDFSFETAAIQSGHSPVAGIDEVGRGPLAGPVMAAAVILDPAHIPAGINDSKKLSHVRREALYDLIMRDAIAVSIGEASVGEIDQINILQATFLAMRRAVDGLNVKPAYALVDGNKLPGLTIPAEAVVKGDGKSLSIGAASIIAKVTRDRLMAKLAEAHPGYGWEQNAGYGTKSHRDAILALGTTAHHRLSFIHND